MAIAATLDNQGPPSSTGLRSVETTGEIIMALELEVFLDRNQLPTADEWSRAASVQKLELEFRAPLEWGKTEGFMPVRLNGIESGFELYWDEIDPNDVEEDLPEAAATKDGIVGFRFSRPIESAAAYAAAGVLALLAQGVLFNPDADRTLQPEQALQNAHHLLRTGGQPGR